MSHRFSNSPPDTDDLGGVDARQVLLLTPTPSPSPVDSSTLLSFRGAGAETGPMRQTATAPSRLHVAKPACGSRKQMLFTCVSLTISVVGHQVWGGSLFKRKQCALTELLSYKINFDPMSVLRYYSSDAYSSPW